MSKEDEEIAGIYCLSDIHSEFYTEEDIDELLEKLKQYSPSGVKYCILAGDIGTVHSEKAIDNYTQVLRYYSQLYPHVILVAGNHEFYNSQYNFENVITTLENISKPFKNVHFLHRKSITLDGVRFIGVTLWSAIDEAAVKQINDFNHIFQHRMDYLSAFMSDYQFLKKELENHIDSKEPNVVVTHHLPTSKLVHPRFSTHPGGSAFHTNILDVLPLKNTKYFYCGHTHECMRTSYGSTQFITNPLGYRFEKRDTVTSKKVWPIFRNIVNTVISVQKNI
jgi:predicted phosphodiesterase